MKFIFHIEEICFIHNLEGLFECAKGQYSRLIIPIKSNFELIDSFLYLPKDSFQYSLTEEKVQNLKIKLKFPDKGIIFFDQIKKNFEETYSKYNEIRIKWEEMKAEISKKIEINSFLILINDSVCCDTGKNIAKFQKEGQEDIFFMFTDTLNKKLFYGSSDF